MQINHFLLFFLFCFLQQDKYKLIRRNLCTVVVINNISRILFQERAQSVKKILPCDDRLLCELKFIFMATLHCLICEPSLLPNPVYLEPDEVYQPFVEIDENLTITKELYMTIASQL